MDCALIMSFCEGSTRKVIVSCPFHYPFPFLFLLLGSVLILFGVKLLSENNFGSIEQHAELVRGACTDL